MVERIRHIVLKYPFASYLAFFLLLFLQLPLHDSLTGKVDTWFFITAFETISNHIEALFTGAEIGNALYPESGVYQFGNYSPGYALVYLPLRAIGLSPLWAYYIFHSFLFASNAFGIYLIGKILLKGRGSAFIAGFFFAACNFAFGSMDNPDALGFFPACLSIYFFLRFIHQGKEVYFLLTVLAGGLEPYFSSYVFLFQCVCLGVIGLGNLKLIFSEKGRRNAFFKYFPIFIALLIPYSMLYVFGEAKNNGWNPGEAIESVAMVSLNPQDLLRFLPENLLWPVMKDQVGVHNWLAGTRAGGIGLLFWGLAIFGWVKWKKMRLALGVIWGLGFLLALGPSIQVGDSVIPMPLYPLYKFAHIHDMFRISIRAWFICVAVFSLCAAYGLRKLTERLPNKLILVSLVLTLFLLENIPFPFHYPNNGHFLELPEAERNFFEPGPPSVVVDLPSSFFSGHHPDFPALCSNEEVDFFSHEVIREYVYTFWQTQHKQHILNAFVGFIPTSRINNQLLINDLKEGSNLEQLIQNNGLEYIFFHKDLQLDCEDTGELNFLRASKLLKVVVEDEEMVVFRVIDEN